MVMTSAAAAAAAAGAGWRECRRVGMAGGHVAMMPVGATSMPAAQRHATIELLPMSRPVRSDTTLTGGSHARS
jgi:hypothetical protein